MGKTHVLKNASPVVNDTEEEAQQRNGLSMSPPSLKISATAQTNRAVPAIQTQTQNSAPAQAQAPPQAPTQLDELLKKGSIELKQMAMENQRIFESEETDQRAREEAALKLVYLFNILQERSNEYRFSYSLGEKPRDKDAEIWQVYGGFGDPLMGDLSSIYPFEHIQSWRETISSWDSTFVDEAYTGSRGKMRFANSDIDADGAEQAYAGMYAVSGAEKGTSRDANRQFAPLQASSDWNRNAMPNPDFEMDVDQLIGVLKKFYPQGVWNDKERKNYLFEEHKDALSNYLKRIKKAFKQAKIDTIQSQAAYLAHGLGEMQFAILTEGQTNLFTDDPAKNTYSTASAGPLGYATDGHSDLKGNHRTVDPLGRTDAFKGLPSKEKTPDALREALNDTFIGRGPIQVTHDYGYAKTLFYMQKLAESTSDAETANELWEAVYAIKKDPSAVGDPKYSFLFSAAYMQATGGVRSTSDLASKIKKIDPGQVRETAKKKKTGASAQQKALLDWVAGEEHNYLRGADDVAKGHNKTVGGSIFNKANDKIEAYNEFFQLISEIRSRQRGEKENEKKK